MKIVNCSHSRAMGVGMFGQNNSQDQNQWQTAANDQFAADTPDPGADPSVSTDSTASDEPVLDAPVLPIEEPTTDSAPASEPSVVSSPSPSAVPTDDLLKIKQDALQELTPLVGHLDQTPEEKFRTTMMMIQAADDQSLLQSAYDAAKQISDEKARAQALLDVINEINYFTQQGK
jgi:hypothetical protein